MHQRRRIVKEYENTCYVKYTLRNFKRRGSLGDMYINLWTMRQFVRVLHGVITIKMHHFSEIYYKLKLNCRHMYVVLLVYIYIYISFYI
jgi:hypothetical protein